ncbi:MAG: substrate-binding domain-containing protein [Polyangiaceae bacterium]
MPKTIAVLIDHADYPAGGYESQLRTGFEATCKRLDLKLLLFFGRALDAPMYQAQNAVYHLAHPDCVDGIILVAPGLGTYTGAEGVRALSKRLEHLPQVSLGLEIPGVPSVIIDNRPGIHALVDHLVEVHKCRSIAYIGGPEHNPDAVVRAQAFEDALLHHGLPINPDRCQAGAFTLPSGSSAMATILERGEYFDSVLAANDGMALGAIETLKARGFRVPHQVRVVGFDDLEIARLVNPPLTTVRQPLGEMATRAVELLLARNQRLDGAVAHAPRRRNRVPPFLRLFAASERNGAALDDGEQASRRRGGRARRAPGRARRESPRRRRSGP